jgi:hypothetical protein
LIEGPPTFELDLPAVRARADRVLTTTDDAAPNVVVDRIIDAPPKLRNRVENRPA